MNPFANLLVF